MKIAKISIKSVVNSPLQLQFLFSKLNCWVSQTVLWHKFKTSEIQIDNRPAFIAILMIIIIIV